MREPRKMVLEPLGRRQCPVRNQKFALVFLAFKSAGLWPPPRRRQQQRIGAPPEASNMKLVCPITTLRRAAPNQPTIHHPRRPADSPLYRSPRRHRRYSFAGTNPCDRQGRAPPERHLRSVDVTDPAPIPNICAHSGNRKENTKSGLRADGGASLRRPRALPNGDSQRGFYLLRTFFGCEAWIWERPRRSA